MKDDNSTTIWKFDNNHRELSEWGEYYLRKFNYLWGNKFDSYIINYHQIILIITFIFVATKPSDPEYYFFFLIKTYPR